MSKKLQFIFLLPVIIIASCKSNETGNAKDVAQDQIYRTYEVNYLEETQVANVSAVFRFAGENGTTLRLNSPGKITANGVELVEGTLLFGGAYYYSSSAVACTDNKVTVSYTDSKEAVLTEIFEAGKATIETKPDTIYLGKSFSVPFSFSGGDNADNFEFVLRDKDLRSLSFYASSKTEKLFDIPGPATDTLTQGLMTLQIISHKRKDLDNHSTLGGIVDFSCYYKPVEVVAVKK